MFRVGVDYAKSYPHHPIEPDSWAKSIPRPTILAGTVSTGQNGKGEIFEFETLLVGVSGHGNDTFTPVGDRTGDANDRKRIVRIFFDQDVSVDKFYYLIGDPDFQVKNMKLVHHEITHIIDSTEKKGEYRLPWAHRPIEVRAMMSEVAFDLESFLEHTDRGRSYSGSFEELLEESRTWRWRHNQLNESGRRKIALGVLKYLQDRRLVK